MKLDLTWKDALPGMEISLLSQLQLNSHLEDAQEVIRWSDLETETGFEIGN